VHVCEEHCLAYRRPLRGPRAGGGGASRAATGALPVPSPYSHVFYNLDCGRGRNGRCTSLGIDPSVTRLRVAWDRGVDGPGDDDLGLYTGPGGDKDVSLRYCANNPALRPSQNNPRATHSLAYDYYCCRCEWISGCGKDPSTCHLWTKTPTYQMTLLRF